MISTHKLKYFLFYFLFQLTLFPESNLKKVSLQLKWYNQFQFAGYYVAKYKGYYEDVGLDVTLLEGGPGANYEDVLSGKINFGVADSRILLAKMEGKPVVSLAAVFQHTPDVIITRADKKLRVPSHLINKKIMLGEYSIPPSIQAIFLREGIPLSSFHTIPNELDVESVMNGKVDALFGYAINEPYQIETQGVDTFLFSPHDYGIDFYGDMLYTSENEIEKNRNRSIAFLTASLRGWKFAMENINETADLILNTPEINKSSFITKRYLSYQGKVLESLILADIVRIGHINPDRIEKTAEIFKNIGLFKGEYSLDGFIFNPRPQVDIRWKKYLIIGGSAIIPLIFLFIASIVILQKLVKNRTKELSKSKAKLEAMNSELEISEKKYKNLVENSKDIIFSLDKDGFILSINRAVKTILKYSPKELIGRNFADLIYNPNLENHNKLYTEIFKFTIQEVIESQGTLTFNSDLANKIGEPLEINISLQYAKMEKEFMILGTAILAKDNDLLRYCLREQQVYKIKNYLTHVDAVCHRLPNAALKYSNQDTVYNIRICLREVLINAIEHGNLNISFDEKTEQQANGDYLKFLIGRQKEPIYANKLVTIEYSLSSKSISFTISDEGNGFDHKKMMIKKTNDKEIRGLGHGRGIMMARDFFDVIEYNEKGNSVHLIKYF